MFEVGQFWFVILVYYKTLSVFMYDTGLSLAYSIIMATISAGIVVFVGFAFSEKIRKLTLEWEASDRGRTIDEFLMVAFFPPFVIAAILNIAIGYIVAFGFSQSFAEKHLIYSARPYASNGGIWKFLVILAGPMIVFYAIQVKNVYKALKQHQK